MKADKPGLARDLRKTRWQALEHKPSRFHALS